MRGEKRQTYANMEDNLLFTADIPGKGKRLFYKDDGRLYVLGKERSELFWVPSKIVFEESGSAALFQNKRVTLYGGGPASYRKVRIKFKQGSIKVFSC